jgi:hypothetical protein
MNPLLCGKYSPKTVKDYIQSTIGRLQNALAPENNYKQYIGEVNYIDYKKEYIPLTICFSLLFKRKAFSTSVKSESYLMYPTTTFHLMMDLKLMNIDQLIEKIYIHPKSENWYKDLVINLVKQLGFDFTIEKSDLESDI